MAQRFRLHPEFHIVINHLDHITILIVLEITKDIILMVISIIIYTPDISQAIGLIRFGHGTGIQAGGLIMIVDFIIPHIITTNTGIQDIITNQTILIKINTLQEY